MTGCLYIIGTPIGNLEDISTRTKRTLESVDLIFCEDTRVSIKLLSHLGISKTLISCHDFNEAARAEELSGIFAEGKTIALISDAGMPLISDPGHKIVQKALELNMEIVVVPGPSSVLLALIGSGLSCQRFSFEGFLPDKAGERRQRLERLKGDERTMVFFVPIKDLEKVLPEMLEIMGKRKACLCRELSKKFEEYIRGDLEDILAISRSRDLKGESVLVLAGAESSLPELSDQDLRAKLKVLLSSGARLKEAAGLLARESGRLSSDIYSMGLEIKAEMKSAENSQEQ